MEDKLLKLLYDEHIITNEQHQQVIEKCKKSDLSYDVILEQLGILNEEQLLEFLSEKFRMSVINWELYQPEQELLELIPEQVATKYTVFPFSLERGKRQNKITLAVADPSNVVAASNDISFMTGCIVKIEISSPRAIRKAIQTYYKKQKNVSEVPGGPIQQEERLPSQEFVPCGVAEFDSLLPELLRSTELEEEPDALSGLDRDHPSTKFLFELLDTAVERGFSEIHIEPYGQEQRVRFSLHGFLHKHTLIPEQIGRGIALNLHRIAHRIDSSVLPKREQDFWTGSFYTTHIQGKPLTVVVHFYPTPFGEKVLLKIKNGASSLHLDNLGIGEQALRTLDRILTKPQGLLLVISPPRHGKSTTLYAILRKFCRSEKNGASLEQRIKSLIPEIVQIPFQPQMSYQDWHSLISFSTPDLIALEHSDNPVLGQLAFDLASSALVLASLTASDFADGLCTFLADSLSGLEKQYQEGLPFLLDAINGAVSQRLIRTICPHCKEEVPLSEQDIELLHWLSPRERDPHSISVYSGKGCHECSETGFSGQTGLFEIVKLDKGLKQFLLQSYPLSSFQVREFWTEMSGGAIKQQAFQKICDGTTSLAEIRRVVFQ